MFNLIPQVNFESYSYYLSNLLFSLQKTLLIQDNDKEWIYNSIMKREIKEFSIIQNEERYNFIYETIQNISFDNQCKEDGTIIPMYPQVNFKDTYALALYSYLYNTYDDIGNTASANEYYMKKLNIIEIAFRHMYKSYDVLNFYGLLDIEIKHVIEDFVEINRLLDNALTYNNFDIVEKTIKNYSDNKIDIYSRAASNAFKKKNISDICNKDLDEFLNYTFSKDVDNRHIIHDIILYESRYHYEEIIDEKSTLIDFEEIPYAIKTMYNKSLNQIMRNKFISKKKKYSYVIYVYYRYLIEDRESENKLIPPLCVDYRNLFGIFDTAFRALSNKIDTQGNKNTKGILYNLYVDILEIKDIEERYYKK